MIERSEDIENTIDAGVCDKAMIKGCCSTNLIQTYTTQQPCNILPVIQFSHLPQSPAPPWGSSLDGPGRS